MGLAGALAALGAFTGLAATHDSGGGSTTQPAASAVPAATPAAQSFGDATDGFFTRDDLGGSNAAGDVFGQRGRGAIGPSGGGSAAAVSGGS